MRMMYSVQHMRQGPKKTDTVCHLLLAQKGKKRRELHL